MTVLAIPWFGKTVTVLRPPDTTMLYIKFTTVKNHITLYLHLTNEIILKRRMFLNWSTILCYRIFSALDDRKRVCSKIILLDWIWLKVFTLKPTCSKFIVIRNIRAKYDSPMSNGKKGLKIKYMADRQVHCNQQYRQVITIGQPPSCKTQKLVIWYNQRIYLPIIWNTNCEKYSNRQIHIDRYL